ncbi:MAG: CoA pyrophosphatase [Chloroflexota bacterium]|nr:CoA pyrophosphatase [Chloroflexota bacterium]
MLNLTSEEISRALSLYQIQQHNRFAEILSFENLNNFRQSAVLIPLLETEGRWHVLLTRRSQELVEHRGQVAFPGGARERGDENLQWTALRETYEEVGVEPHDVQILGSLGDMPIITGYTVRLFVGEIPWPYKLTVNTDEVESAFVVPLDWLADSKHRRIKYRNFAGREIPVIFFDPYEGYQLWGASAEMTLALLSAFELID